MLILLFSSGGFPPQNTPIRIPRGCARELAALGLVSRLTGPVEDVKCQELDVDVGSRAGNPSSDTVLTLDKKLIV